MTDPVRIVFRGHACVEIDSGGGRRLCVDPWRSGDFGGLVPPGALPDHFALALSTHPHGDHNAFDAIPSARPLAVPCREPGLRVEAHVAAHDEFAGRLRGCLVQQLRIETGGVRVLHCGDLGERPTGALLAWFRQVPIDLLVVPVGGYFTLDADGAAELTALVRPRFVLPCHSSDDGARFPEIRSRRLFDVRFPRHAAPASELALSPACGGDWPGDPSEITVLHLRPPTVDVTPPC